MDRQYSSIQPNGSSTNPKHTGAPMPMKWHKFLIYFSLWLGAAMNVVSGLGMFTGSVYMAQGVDPETVYRAYDGLKTVDVLFGVASIALAVLAIMARFALAGYKKNGPRLLLVGYVLTMVLAVVYPLLASATTGLAFGDLFEASSLVSGAAGFAINKVYYDKRAHLFVRR